MDEPQLKSENFAKVVDLSYYQSIEVKIRERVLLSKPKYSQKN